MNQYEQAAAAIAARLTFSPKVGLDVYKRQALPFPRPSGWPA